MSADTVESLQQRIRDLELDVARARLREHDMRRLANACCDDANQLRTEILRLESLLLACQQPWQP